MTCTSSVVSLNLTLQVFLCSESALFSRVADRLDSHTLLLLVLTLRVEPKQQPGQMDAFSLLMMNAGRNQAAAAGAGSKQTKRKPGSTERAASPAKRVRGSQDSPEPQPQEQQEQPATQHASSAQHAIAADTRTPAAAVDKKAAMAAFKRAFSAGAASSRKPQQFDTLLVYVSMCRCVSAL